MRSEFPDSWRSVLDQRTQDALQLIESKLRSEEAVHSVWPRPENRYRALKLVPPDKVRVVILGQDPYYQEGLANGLAFSVNRGVAIPGSLKSVFKEVTDDVGAACGGHGDLTCWAEQGVLLLNSILTVRQGVPKSHEWLGWEVVTSQILRYISQNKQPTAFMFWGRKAERSGRVVAEDTHHCILPHAAHPSPWSCKGFFGKHHFSKTNRFLSSRRGGEIDWSAV